MEKETFESYLQRLVIKSLTENGKKKTVNLLEGMDHVIEIGEFIKLL